MSTEYTSKGLPKVGKETVDFLFERFKRGNGYGQYLSEVQNRLIQEQPDLVNFINSQVGKYPKEMHIPMLEVVVGVYGLLEQQADDSRPSQETIN